MKKDFNALTKELDNKYFPQEKWFDNDENIRKIHSNCELFNNGSLTLGKLVKNLAKITKEEEITLTKTVLKHYDL